MSNQSLATDITGIERECLSAGLHGTAGVIRWALTNVRDGCERPVFAAARLRRIADELETPLVSGRYLDRAATLLDQWRVQEPLP